MVAVAALAGCKGGTAVTKVTVPSTSTTSTTAPALSQLNVVGVRPGVLQAPFYPQITVTQVSCGVDPGRGRFVRIDLPAGGAGTPVHTVFTKPTAVIVVPGAAVVVDPRYPHRVLYDEAMINITTGTQGVFVLSMSNFNATGSDGLTVAAGALQLNGDYQCPTTDVAYPGT